MKRRIGIVLALAAGLLCGCNANELENRCFPMLSIVDYEPGEEKVSFCYTFPTPRREEDQGTATGELDASFSYGETFEKAWEFYEKKLNKEADYNHLKVLVIGREFLENENLCSGMIDFLQEKETFPRNAYVCVMDEPEELLEVEESLSDDAGTYLEDFLKKNHTSQNEKLVTLGKMMDEQENRRLKLHLPYLMIEEGSVVWEENYILGTADK